MKRGTFLKDNLPLVIGMLVTAIGITVTGIVFKQSPFRILPLYISLLVALLQSRMIRLAYLIGGLNSILYGVVFIHYHVYGSAASALLFSFPVQIVTYILWSRNPWGNTTVFRKMSWKVRGLVAALFAASVAGMQIVLRLSGGNHVTLDSFSSLLGILTTVLVMFAVIEYAPLMVVSGLLSLSLYCSMIAESPEMSTYLVFQLYSLTCSTVAFFRIRKVYHEQRKAACEPVPETPSN